MKDQLLYFSLIFYLSGMCLVGKRQSGILGIGNSTLTKLTKTLRVCVCTGKTYRITVHYRSIHVLCTKANCILKSIVVSTTSTQLSMYFYTILSFILVYHQLLDFPKKKISMIFIEFLICY